MTRAIDVQHLSDEQIDQQARVLVEAGPVAIVALQGAILAMVGPEAPQLGRMAIRSPGQFYIDDRVSDRSLAYPRLAIEQAVRILEAACQVGQIDPATSARSVERLPHLGLW